MIRDTVSPPVADLDPDKQRAETLLTIAKCTRKADRLSLARRATATLPRSQRVAAQQDLLTEATRIEALQRSRAETKRLPEPPSPRERLIELRNRILAAGIAEIERRRLYGSTWSLPQFVEDRKGSLALLAAEGWYEYSKRYGTFPRRVCWLYGRDDSGPWAIRVPKSITSVAAAITWLTPAAVLHAQKQGRWTGRQGDVYLVELRSGRDNLIVLTRRWGNRHIFDSVTRTLNHPEHRPLVVPAHVRAVRAFAQSTIGERGTGYSAD